MRNSPDSKYKDKNSDLKTRHATFAGAMIMLCRLLLLVLLCCPSLPATSLPHEFIWSQGTDELNRFESNGKIGLKNKKGDIIIPAEYEALGWSNGEFSVVDNITGYKVDNKWGLINLTNHKITKAAYVELLPSNGAAFAAGIRERNSIRLMMGCINSAGKVLVPFAYDILKIAGLRAIVGMKSGYTHRYGLIDLGNRVLIPLQHESLYPIGSLRYAVISSNGKTAIFDENGTALTDFVIDSISVFKKNFAILYQNKLQGLIDREGRIVLEPIFRGVRVDGEGKVFTRRSDAWLFLDGDNRQLRAVEADSVVPLSPTLYKLNIGGRFQLTDQHLKPISQNVYTNVFGFYAGKAVVTLDGKQGVINTSGKIVLAPQYDRIVRDDPYFLGLSMSGNAQQYAVHDSTGQKLSSKNYQYIGNFNGSFFPAQYKGFWGGLGVNGREMIACVHDSIIQHAHGLVVVKFRSQYGIIDIAEKWMVTPQPHRLQIVSADRYLLFFNGQQYLKSLTGDVIYFTPNRLEIKQDHVLEHLPEGGMLKVNFNGQIVDRIAVIQNIEAVFPLSEGYRAIKKNGRYGFIDERSRLRVANRYEDVQAFSEGLAAAKILGRWGFVSKQDQIIIQPVYDEVTPFTNGISIVRQKKLFGVIDKNGTVVLPVRYDKVERLDIDRFRVYQQGLVGLADRRGQLILNPKYESVVPVKDYIIVGREGKFGVISSSGLSTIPLMYDGLTFDSFHGHFLAVQRADWQPANLK